MANDWFKYSDHTVTSVSEFTGLIFAELRSAYLFRGHRGADWGLDCCRRHGTSVTPKRLGAVVQKNAKSRVQAPPTFIGQQ